ncbi:hypothetical protein ED733_000192, partial [Metarhizium rileyi]
MSPVTEADVRKYNEQSHVVAFRTTLVIHALTPPKIDRFGKFFDQRYASTGDHFLGDLFHIVGDGEPERLKREFPKLSRKEA